MIYHGASFAVLMLKHGSQTRLRRTALPHIKADILTMQTGTPLLQAEHPLPLLFPGMKLLAMRGSHGVQLHVAVLQLSHQQLELPPLPLDGGATQFTHRKLLETHRKTHVIMT